MNRLLSTPVSATNAQYNFTIQHWSMGGQILNLLFVFYEIASIQIIPLIGLWVIWLKGADWNISESIW